MLALAFALAVIPGAVDGNSSDYSALLDEISATQWKERRFASRGSDYVFVDRAGERFLEVESEDGASALYRRLTIPARSGVRLSWRWRIDEPLEHARLERTREGDDYAARVVVMFDGKPFGRTTRALMYVWAQREPVGASYASPYSGNVATLVLRNGVSSSGRWFFESRRVVEDFERTFGEKPGRITAIAIMVDTDNTGSRAVTSFDALMVHSVM